MLLLFYSLHNKSIHIGSITDLPPVACLLELVHQVENFLLVSDVKWLRCIQVQRANQTLWISPNFALKSVSCWQHHQNLLAQTGVSDSFICSSHWCSIFHAWTIVCRWQDVEMTQLLSWLSSIIILLSSKRDIIFKVRSTMDRWIFLNSASTCSYFGSSCFEVFGW